MNENESAMKLSIYLGTQGIYEERMYGSRTFLWVWETYFIINLLIIKYEIKYIPSQMMGNELIEY